MAAKEVLKKATLNLSCPVCYQVFKNPKYLPCYHSYCEECLEKMVKQSKITCPECRMEVIVPAGGVKELASNFLINRLVDELILKRKVEGEEEVRCDNCDEDDPVVTFCPDCGLFFCHVCNETHKRAKASRDHDIVPLTEMKSKQDIVIQPKAKAPMCKKHDIELLFYCETCEELVCMYCTVKDHAGHEHDTVKLMASKHRNELKDLTAPVEEMITDLSQAHDNIEKMRKMIIQRGEQVDNEIDQHYNELVKRLMEQKEQTKQQAHNAVSQKDKAMMKQLQEVEHAQAEVLSMKELKGVVEKSSDQEALSAKKQVIDRMQQLTTKYKKLNTQPVQSATMEFVSTKQPLPQFGQLFTHVDPAVSEIVNLPNNILVGEKVEFTIITKYHNGHHCSRCGSQVSVQLESNSGEVTAVQVRDNNDGSYVASFATRTVGKVKVSVSANGQQIKGSPYTVNVTPPSDYTKVTKPSKIVNNGGSMGQPWGLACGKNGVLAVADNTNHCVYVFDGQDNLIKKIGSHGSGIGQFNDPCGITFDCNDHLYVADRLNHRVQKFDVSGNYMFQYGGGKGSQDGQLNGPRGVTVHDGRLYVADRENCRISVFQIDGPFCCIIGKGNVSWPYDVAVNVNNQLLVADMDSDCVHTFTLDGRYITKLGTRGSGVGQLLNPVGLLVDLNGFIFIAEYNNHRVSVFNKDGKYIHHFGSRGRNDGQFQCCTGVAISPDHKIYVSDYNGKRVQIFLVN
ncbi:E3 ubiquitin-protein ligase TRIM71-like [Dysidea avara]|uniref:E3 ubiquitin-protein ligase TRIM71-like n=1 Tax=Dysidea avara TaxID=196820 RepID=UPI0033257CC4